jgi:hypothetical protein
MLAKDIKRIAYEITLLSIEIHILQVANKALNKYHRAKKARVRQGNILTIEDTQDIISQKDIDKQVQRDVRITGCSRKKKQPSGRYYKIYRKASHNTRTCQETIDISSSSDSD